MFTVIWKNSALNQLAEIYVSVTPEQRNKIFEAVTDLNARLEVGPLEIGESRGHIDRIVFVPLLSLFYSVDQVSKVVRVTWVMKFGR
jgi:hypothetical protein